jgi:hypothetical protein
MGDTDAGGIPNRRTAKPRGRRASDLIALAPELQVEALDYAAEIKRCLNGLTMARDEHAVATRHAWMELRIAADALHVLLATGESQRTPSMPDCDRLKVPTSDGQTARRRIGLAFGKRRRPCGVSAGDAPAWRGNPRVCRRRTRAQ